MAAIESDWQHANATLSAWTVPSWTEHEKKSRRIKSTEMHAPPSREGFRFLSLLRETQNKMHDATYQTSKANGQEHIKQLSPTLRVALLCYQDALIIWMIRTFAIKYRKRRTRSFTLVDAKLIMNCPVASYLLTMAKYGRFYQALLAGSGNRGHVYNIEKKTLWTNPRVSVVGVISKTSNGPLS